MSNYAIDICRVGRNGRELAERLEFPREHFTNREFRNYLILHLLDLASDGHYYKHLDAIVTRDGQKFLTVRCDAELEGNQVKARLVMARPREVYRPLRTALIAEGREAQRWLRR